MAIKNSKPSISDLIAEIDGDSFASVRNLLVWFGASDSTSGGTTATSLPIDIEKHLWIDSTGAYWYHQLILSSDGVQNWQWINPLTNTTGTPNAPINPYGGNTSPWIPIKVTDVSGANKGRIHDAILQRDNISGVTTIHDLAGNIFSPLPASMQIGEKVCVTGYADFQDISGVSDFTGKGIVIPAHTQVAIGHVDGGEVVYTVAGDMPVGGPDTYGRRVHDGGTIILNGQDEIFSFKVLDLSGVPDISFEFKNIN